MENVNDPTYTLADLCRDAADRSLDPTPEQMENWRAIAARYPYLTLPAMMELSHTPADSPERSKITARVALSAPDIDSLLRLIDPDAHSLSGFYPAEEEPDTPTTSQALDTFLATYAHADDLPDETRLLEKIIFNPVPADYALTLTDDDPLPQPADEQDSLLDAFLASQGVGTALPAAEPERPAATSIPAARADDPLSESLAMIYIRQGRYEKAYEIIRQLSLNFPKKSIYFADQLRFLRKLMLNAGSAK
ncbi:MAG: hypothetical protein K2H74_01135 [Paramuribaculum sp.]|nr:hypothetical protein [Paramuribaculum sp.]